MQCIIHYLQMEIKLESALSENFKDLNEIVNAERKVEYFYRIEELKSKLPDAGRCMVCTLKLPCKHYKNIEEMPETPQFLSETPAISAAVQALKPEKKILRKIQKDQSFTVRYRGKETNYLNTGHTRQSSLPSSQKLKVLEKVEAYREEKIKKEIEKIQFLREEEKIKERIEKKKDEKRRKHAMELKLKIEEYHDEYQMKREQIKLYIEQDRQRKQLEEQKRRKYLELKKKELYEYSQKKSLMERISKQKVSDLEEVAVKAKFA